MIAIGIAAVISHPAVASESFQVVGVEGDRARAILARAERLKGDISNELFGVAARRWEEPCEIHVHHGKDAFERAVGGSPGIARGATSIEFVAGRVTLRRIDLEAEPGEIVPEALDHELVHVVLADRFLDSPPPRWADEGLAVLFDNSHKQQFHDEDFRVARREGSSWPCEDLLAMEQFPPGDHRLRVFYGQSASLVRWLVARRDTKTFVAFLADHATLGIDAALERHYAIPSKDALAAAWGNDPPAASLVSVVSEDR